MLRKLSSLVLVLAFAVSIVFVSGCGPKGTPQELLDELGELKAASEACDNNVLNLERQKADREREKATKEARLESLTEERDALKAELGIVK